MFYVSLSIYIVWHICLLILMKTQCSPICCFNIPNYFSNSLSFFLLYIFRKLTVFCFSCFSKPPKMFHIKEHFLCYVHFQNTIFFWYSLVLKHLLHHYTGGFPNWGDGGESTHQPKICSSPHLEKFPPVDSPLHQIFVILPTKSQFLSPTKQQFSNQNPIKTAF